MTGEELMDEFRKQAVVMTEEQFAESCRQAEESNRILDRAADVLAGRAPLGNFDKRPILTLNKMPTFINEVLESMRAWNEVSAQFDDHKDPDITAITREIARS